MKKTLMLVAVLFMALTACGTAQPAAPAAAIPTTTPQPRVTLLCPECYSAGMKINLWTSPDRSGIAGSVPHNTPAIVTDTAVYNGVLHYKVVTGANVSGWVSELFIGW